MSASVGMGKSESSGGGTSSAAEEQMLAMAREFEEETDPLRTAFIAQLEQALSPDMQTAAQIPIIASSMEASRRAGSDALRTTEEDLARTGLAGTPFGEQVRSTTRQEGAYQTSQIPAEYLWAMQQMIPNFVLGASQVSTAGLPGITEGTESKGFSTEMGGAAKP